MPIADTKSAEPDLVDTLVRSAANTMIDLPGNLARAGGDALVTVTRATYTSAYFIAYAAVFTTVFVVRAIPRKNPVMEGFEDGGRAAGDAIADLGGKGPKL